MSVDSCVTTCDTSIASQLLTDLTCHWFRCFIKVQGNIKRGVLIWQIQPQIQTSCTKNISTITALQNRSPPDEPKTELPVPTAEEGCVNFACVVDGMPWLGQLALCCPVIRPWDTLGHHETSTGDTKDCHLSHLSAYVFPLKTTTL